MLSNTPEGEALGEVDEMDIPEDLDLSLPISTLLKVGTMRAHVKAEHSEGAKMLVQGGLGLEEYVRWLAVLWRIYRWVSPGWAVSSGLTI
jgi:hypothetical protein